MFILVQIRLTQSKFYNFYLSFVVYIRLLKHLLIPKFLQYLANQIFLDFINCTVLFIAF